MPSMDGLFRSTLYLFLSLSYPRLPACLLACLLACLRVRVQGFFGAFGERGLGGSKCGSTCALALLVQEQGQLKVVSVNTGDARVVLIKGEEVMQLSTDHVPDEEAERKRIERTNPNPKMPLVRFIGDCWRVGGVLALSRAFGDALLKPTNVDEGISISGTMS